MPGADGRLLRVADGDQHGVRAQQDDGPRAQQPVPPDEAVLAEDALQPRQSRDQQHQDEEQVGAREAGEAAGGGCEAAGSDERSVGLGREPQAEGDAEAEGGHRRDDVRGPLGRRGGRAAHGLSVFRTPEADVKKGWEPAVNTARGLAGVRFQTVRFPAVPRRDYPARSPHRGAATGRS